MTEPPTDPDSEAAVRELEAALPPQSELLRMAREDPPPQAWFDEAEERTFSPPPRPAPEPRREP